MFNSQQISFLSRHFDIDVIAPVSWVLRRRRSIPKHKCENNIQVFHPVYYYTPGLLRNWYGWFYYLSLRKEARKLLRKNEYIAVFASWLYPDGWAAMRLADDNSLPLFLKVHGTDVNSLTPISGVTRAAMLTVSRAKKVICVSDALKDRLLGLGAEKDKLVTLRNGIDKKIFYPMDRQVIRKELQVSLEEKVILYVGNLKREKGLEELSTAIGILHCNQLVENLRLIIIGTGPYQDRLKEYFGSLNLLGRVDFLGSRPLLEIAQWMNAANVLCLPSYLEGMPNVVLEALACGTRIVATAVGGIPELDVEGDLLLLVPPKSVMELTSALEKMIYLSDEKEGVRKEKGWEGIITWEENAAALADHIGVNNNTELFPSAD